MMYKKELLKSGNVFIWFESLVSREQTDKVKATRTALERFISWLKEQEESGSEEDSANDSEDNNQSNSSEKSDE